jgi:hypothetical protein
MDPDTMSANPLEPASAEHIRAWRRRQFLGDFDAGVSFAVLSSGRIPDPWHSERMEIINNLVHSAID